MDNAYTALQIEKSCQNQCSPEEFMRSIFGNKIKNTKTFEKSNNSNYMASLNLVKTKDNKIIKKDNTVYRRDSTKIFHDIALFTCFAGMLVGSVYASVKDADFPEKLPKFFNKDLALHRFCYGAVFGMGITLALLGLKSLLRNDA